MRYEDVYRRSVEEPEAFWAEEAHRIYWHVPPKQITDYSNPPFRRWYVGGQTNLCYNAVDRHGRTPRPAGAGGHFHRNQRHPRDHLPRAVPRSERVRRRAAAAGRAAWRPRGHLHAEHGRSGVRHARLRAHRGDPFGGVWWFRRAQPCAAHRRRRAQAADRRRCRQARRQGDSLQGHGRCRLRRGEVAAAACADRLARSGPGRTEGARPRRRLRHPARGGRRP